MANSKVVDGAGLFESNAGGCRCKEPWNGLFGG